MTEPRDDRSTPGPAAEADDPVYLAARLAEAQDQLAATREILSVLAQAVDVGGRRLRGGRRQRPQALPRRRPPRSTSPTGTGTGWWRSKGLNPEYADVRGRPPGSPRPGHAHRPGGDRPPHPADRRRAGRPRLQPARVPAAGGYRSIIGAPMIVDDEVVGVLSVWRTTVEPFDEHTRALLTTFAEQAALALRNVELLPALQARSARAGAQGRRDGGAGGGRAGGQLDPRPGRGAHDHRGARCRAVRRRRRVADGVRRGEPAVPRAHDLRHERRRPRAAQDRAHPRRRVVRRPSGDLGAAGAGRRPVRHRARPAPAACSSTPAGARSW